MIPETSDHGISGRCERSDSNGGLLMTHGQAGKEQWRYASVLVAVGAAMLGIGLLLGPTPSDDPAQAMRDIDSFSGRYIVTNAVDLVGILGMASGLIALGHVQFVAGGGASALVAAAANTAGAVLIALTLVLQSTVDPAVAEQFVAASGDESAALLSIGRTVMDIDGAVFGLGFLLQMLGIAGVALTFLRGAGPRLNRPFLFVGGVLALGASTTGIAALFEDTFGDVEALLGLIALLWLVALSVLLLRTDAR